MSLIEEVMQAALVAPEERKTEALRVLRGEKPVGSGQSADGSDGPAVEPYVSLREVARRLGISTCSLWRYGVPSHSFAGRARFRVSEVEAHLLALESIKRGTTKHAKDTKGERGISLAKAQRRERLECGKRMEPRMNANGRE